MKKTILILGIATAMIFSACKKDSTTTNSSSCTITGTSYNVANLPADTIIGVDTVRQQGYGANVKTYFSLSNNSIVPSSDSLTTNWDLAFIGTKIYVNKNNGSLAAGFIYNGSFDGLCSVPSDSTFSTSNLPFSSWYNYDGANYVIVPNLNNILVVKTASGKYAKIEISNYYKGGVTPTNASDPTFHDRTYNPRFYTFRYIYQPNSTTNF